MTNKIRLSYKEMLIGAQIGIMRRVQSMKRGYTHAHGRPDNDDWQRDIEGALGEMALAKYLNLYWVGGEVCAVDVGDFEVRTTVRPNGRLILHPKDDDTRYFWLVTGINGVYEIKGHILASEGKRDEYWSDPTGRQRHAYFVPQSALVNPATKPML